jgi:hypothetical protein
MERELRGKASTDGRGWTDHLGFTGPFQPGVGPRSDPAGEFPTGPAVGERLPEVVAGDQWGNQVDVHRARAEGPLVLVFFRSAVW